MANLEKLNNIKNILFGLLGLTLVIVVHEFGHFSACKLFNVRTPTFSIGFDPQIFSYKIGETDFQIGALPLGGYVSINTQDLAEKSYIKKMIIILAGIVFNIIFTLIIFYYLWAISKKEIQINSLKSFLLMIIPKQAMQAMPKDNENNKSNLIGPIGIASLMGKSIGLGFNVFVYFLAIISLNIAIFNLLPIPFFDGGQAAQVTIEALYGKDLPENIVNLIYMIFFILFLVLTFLISAKDIKKLRK